MPLILIVNNAGSPPLHFMFFKTFCFFEKSNENHVSFSSFFLSYLVIFRDDFISLTHLLIRSIQRSLAHKLQELMISLNELEGVWMESNVDCRADFFLGVLIVSHFTSGIR